MTEFPEHLCWQNQVERLRQHAAADWADPARRYLFLGNQVEGGAPFVVPAVRANPHVWVMGGAGTGKSALVLAPLVVQLLQNRVGSVAVFDPKPDKALFESCRLTAAGLGLPFRHVCITPGMSSYSFPPLLQTHFAQQTLTARAETLVQALNLDYGVQYGAAYYTAMVETFVRNVLARFPAVRSPEGLAELFDRPDQLRGLVDAKTWDDSNHVRSIFAKLAGVTSLNLTPGTPGVDPRAVAAAVDLIDLFRERQVAYFALDSAQLRTTTRSVIGLGFYNLLAAAAFAGRYLPPHAKVPVACVIDEAQEIVAPNLEILLDQARDLGIQLVLAHQNLEQLHRKERDYQGVLEENTGLQVVFNPVGRKVREWMEKTSGQRVQVRLGWEQDWYGGLDMRDGRRFGPDQARRPGWFEPPRLSVREELAPRWDQDTIMRLSACRGVAWVRVGQGYESSSWTPVQMLRHIDEATFHARRRQPWPAATAETVLVEHETAFDRRRRTSATPAADLRSRIRKLAGP